MEGYDLLVCHAGTTGGLLKLDEMICPILSNLGLHPID
jgi:hypothetical protein